MGLMCNDDICKLMEGYQIKLVSTFMLVMHITYSDNALTKMTINGCDASVCGTYYGILK